MKILYVGKFKKKTATEHIISKAFTSIGCSVVKVDYTTGDVAKKIANACSPIAPDFTLFSKSLGVDARLIRGIPSRKAMWIFDGLHARDAKKIRGDGGPEILEKAKLMDVVFTVAKCDMDTYEVAGCKKVVWLPQAVDESHNRHYPAGGRTEDAVFIGNGYGSYRTRFLSGVRALGSKVSIYGSLWDIASHKSVSMLEVSRVYSGAKCAIGMGEIESAKIDQFSCRVWHILGSRCVLLHKRLPSLESLFTEGEHLFFWENERECHNLIQKLKADPETVERVALNAYREVHGKHTYKHRVMAMLETMRGLQ